MENKALQIWELYLSFFYSPWGGGWKNFGTFVLYATLRLARDKTKTSDRIDERHIIWAIYLYIGGGGKVFGQFEVRKQFLLHNIQNNCT